MQQGTEERQRPRFTRAEVRTLCQRFAPLDQALLAEGEDYLPSFLIRGPVPYRLYELPIDFDVDTFVASWS